MDELAFREAAFAWLRARMLIQPVFSRAELAQAEIFGETVRLVSTQTGIWKPKQLTAALSILTGFYSNTASRPYEDRFGEDELLRYKWRGENAQQADNRWLRSAMDMGVPLIWFVGIGYRPGTGTQLFQPIMPVWLIAEEPEQHQFVVALDPSQRSLIDHGRPTVSEIERRYNEATAVVRLHQPLFRSRVLHAYQRQCAICRLPFEQLLDAAHIQSDSGGGAAAVHNGLALCKIHHGAFDANILGITPDYTVTIKARVLETFDGPTLQHALKEMHGLRLAQLPKRFDERPRPDLLEQRYEIFLAAS